MAGHELTSRLLDFIFGGNATFTILNEKTHNRFTFKVVARKKNDDGHTIHFVKVLRGTDNEHDYTYMGCVVDQLDFKTTQKSRVSVKAMSFKAFEWLMNVLTAGKKLPDNVHFYHAGRCARCGRKLTVPESIESGFGPECAARAGF